MYAPLLCSASLLQMLVDWMAKEGIVQRILRTNLHQRQYVQEVSPSCKQHSGTAKQQHSGMPCQVSSKAPSSAAAAYGAS
jgi:hypothetical protein